MMRPADESEEVEKRLCRSSDPDVRSLLFRMSSDLLVSILSYLDVESIRQVDIAVSNAAERVIWLTSLSANNLVTFDKYGHCDESIRWVVKRGIRLENLKIGGDTLLMTYDIFGGTFFSLDTSSLRRIDLRDSMIGDEDVVRIAHGCPRLAEICLFGSDGITDASLIALGKFSRQLILMDIGRCFNITDEGLQGFADGCLNVKDMNLPDGLHTGDMDQNCHLRHMSISDTCVPVSAHSTSLLRIVNLSRCEQITDVGILALAHSCPLLSDIDLYSCMQITDTAISAVAHSCPHLSTLDLSCCLMITDRSISALVSSCPPLSSIKLGKCEQITDIGISALSNSFPHLKCIDLSACRQITDLGISAIARSCHHLSSITLFYCIQITDIDLSALADGCHLLTSIDLFDCKHITDTGITALAQSCHLLRNINLSDCKNITDMGVFALARNCPQLSIISLYGCSQITDRGISTLGNSCRDLRSIDLSHCEEISDIGLVRLAQTCPNLYNIQLPYCENITEMGVSVIVMNSRFLSSICLFGCRFTSSDFLRDLQRDYPRLNIS